MTTRRTLLQALCAMAGMRMPAPASAKPGASGPAGRLLVLSQGGRRLALADGASLRILAQAGSAHTLHGRPAFTPDGRHAFFGAPDGSALRFDLADLRLSAQARVGTELRALSADSAGQWLMAGNAAPHSAVLLDGRLQTAKAWPAQTLDRRRTSPVESVVHVAARNSFVLALRDIAELWEISLNPLAPPIHDGLVHDYKMGEAIASPGYLGVRRTPLDEPLGSLLAGPNPAYVIGATRPRAGGTRSAQVINLDVRRLITGLAIDGAPHPAGGALFDWQGAPALAIPNRMLGLVSVIEARSWKKLRDIPIPGPGQAVRSHPALPGLWADAALGSHARGTLTVIDRNTLTPAGQASDPAGQPLGPVEFTHDGRRAIAVTPGQAGALLAFDTASQMLLARQPLEGAVAAWPVPHPLAGADGTTGPAS